MEADANLTRTDTRPGIELDHYTSASGARRSVTAAITSISSHHGPRPIVAPRRAAVGRANFQKWWSDNITLSLTHSCNEDPTRNHDPRNYLALERTYLAHVRTASALVLFGVALVQLFRLRYVDSKAGLALGATCAGGGIIVLAGAYRYFLLQTKLRRGKAAAGGPGSWIGWTVILGAVGAVFVYNDRRQHCGISTSASNGLRRARPSHRKPTPMAYSMDVHGKSEAYGVREPHFVIFAHQPGAELELWVAQPAIKADNGLKIVYSNGAGKMFKKDISPGAKSKVKSSVQRAIRTKIIETYPLLAPHIDEIIPKKSQLDLLKLPDRVTLYALDSSPLFFQHMDDPIIPHLRIVHQFPHAFRRIRIDRGAIRFVLSGATLMAPGLTSAGGRLPSGSISEKAPESSAGEDGRNEEGQDEEHKRYEGRDLEEGDVVVVEAEGKEEACMIGQLRVGTREIKEKKKGVVIDSGHYLGDGLWRMELD
ncbi:MAG: hypothetical protein Q9172_001979 [Xanthocarpia lactea]